MDQFDYNKFEWIHQVGGIRTARYDWPEVGGSPGCRVALVDTGAGLRFTVALDRGGDIVEAFYQNTALAYLTPNGYQPPSHALQQVDDQWLSSWPGGLVTTCGPRYMGPGREEDGKQLYLHGPHSNSPASLLAVHNPELQSGNPEMSLEMKIRDTRFHGPVVEVRRKIVCTLGDPSIRIEDEVINLGNETVPHNLLYHVNFGYPLLDEGARLVFGGRITGVWDGLELPAAPAPGADYNPWKNVPGNLAEHAGEGSRGLVLDVNSHDGTARVGLINHKRRIGIELAYLGDQLPRLANWQHFGPSGTYVSALEPFFGSLFGKSADDHPLAAQYLEPGQSRNYQLMLQIHADDSGIEQLGKWDQELVA